MNFLNPYHVQLLNSSYPPSSSLLTAGPDYSPNSQELSRLTYYASNHPGKLAKLGSELEKRIKLECKKAQAGNIRTRASLLISLAILRSLATECRRDIALFSPSLIAAISATMAAVPKDLEVMARAASVFTAWTTYTDGHLIGADSNMTREYINVLKRFAALSCSDVQDQEVRNRTRLVGFAALTGALNSEALYNDSVQFRTQVSVIMKPILVTVFQTNVDILEHQAEIVKDAPISPYLAEFRTRPAMERRAASIHVHIDGETGPSMSEVSSAALRALFSLLEHANGGQLGHIMRASLDTLDEVATTKKWSQVDHCCWFAKQVAEWAQYQYRYAIPTWLVERLVENQEAPTTVNMHTALAAMVTAVFDSPTPLVNLSTSDVVSNLMNLLLRRTSISPDDALLPALVECISSLGRHVYYSDQIQDLAGEIINRILAVEAQNLNAKTKRTRVPPDIWQDTLSILCETDYAVRADYALGLIFYLENEIPTVGETSEGDGVKKIRHLIESPFHHNADVRILVQSGDFGTKFLNAIQAYVYALATSSSLGLSSGVSSSGNSIANGPATAEPEGTATEESEGNVQGNGRRSIGSQAPRARKVSVMHRLLDRSPSRASGGAAATLSDYSHILSILNTIHEQFPVRGLLTGVPMLLALDKQTEAHDGDDFATTTRKNATKMVIARVWAAIGRIWGSTDLINIANKAIASIPPAGDLPSIPDLEFRLHPAYEAVSIPSEGDVEPWHGIDSQTALLAIASCPSVHAATGLDQQSALVRLSVEWTAELALKDSIERSNIFESTIRGDGVSPLLKISPALMHIDNVSLASLARSTRGIGVTDLREALEGRSSMSNPALVKPPSVSTFDHVSSIAADSKFVRQRTKSRRRATPSGPAEVRDVLNRLGIGKTNGSLLKSSFPIGKGGGESGT
ncbi:Cellular morphogenesis-related protein [Mycena indigotica]|uniref:Cellular morphogenesis-related protein n=1 Tax=Mycena indigotica TaxID=2126181 RepID=A0A8H6SML4_9AGAR|nr:Cellular morphogenesis-related protein [Mycena indigotica]KAF7301808.1 Cellular morphogenesis-related protein [Mycena indigotica]